MTQRPDRQPEDVDSPMHPAADPDLDDGTELSPTRREHTEHAEEEPTGQERDA